MLGKHAADVKYVGTLGVFLLVLEHWLSGGQPQHGGPRF